MSIEQTIKTTVEDMGLPYFLGSYPYLNKTLDFLLHENRQFPICLNIQSTGGRIDLQDGAYHQSINETQNVTIAFADSIPFDYEPAQVQEQIERLKLLGTQFLLHLNQSGRTAPVTGATVSIGFDEFDANLVLVLFTFDVRDAQGGCIGR